jgi:gliding motility-associated-like protein
MNDLVLKGNGRSRCMDLNRYLKGVLIVGAFGPWGALLACLNSYTFTASPMPLNGTYACGQTVNFCFTVTNWSQQNTNWFHGLSIALGPGWDASTLTPVSAPPPCQGTGSWDWYTSVTGTAGTNIGPQGPGWFFNTGAPGDPGNNFGDNCAGAVNWQFCWSVTVMSTPDCVGGADLSVTVDTFGDSETGSWGSAGCHNDPIPTGPPATVENCPSAGLDNNVVFCSTGSTVPLVGQLLGAPDAGGAWTGPGGSTFSGNFNPASDAQGNYTYTISTVVPPCFDAATLAVSVVDQPSAGTDSAFTLCSNAAAFPLLDALGGAPDAGGGWTAPGGAPAGTLFNPATAMPGVYVYQITAMAPCVTVQAQADINVVPAANAGTNGTLLVCSTGAPVNLFTALGGSPSAGGVWTDAGANVVSGQFNPSVATPGIHVFTYTLAAAPPCMAAASTVSVQVVDQLSAGIAASSLDVCEDAAVVDLFTQLGNAADPGGTWTGPGGSPADGSFTPGPSPDGTYTYSIAATAPCVADAATVTVSTFSVPGDAGTNGSIVLCSTDAALSLVSLLGGSPNGGTWTTPGGAPFGGSLDPSQGASGTYAYTVAANGPCPGDASQVVVTIHQSPVAGVDGSLALCSTVQGAQPLIGSLGGSPDATGAWSGPGGGAHGPTFLPGTDPEGIYIYTVPGQAPCVAASASVTVSMVQAPDAGIGGAAAICQGDPVFDPMTWLSGTPDPNGTWSAPGGGSLVQVDPLSAASGMYIYTVPGTAPCPAAQAVMNVVVAPLPDAGVDGVLTLCINGSAQALFDALGGTPDPTGQWSGPSVPVGGMFTPGVQQAGTYTYAAPGLGACAGWMDSAVVQVQVVALPVPNVLLGNTDGCLPFTLSPQLLGPANAVTASWSFGDGTVLVGLPQVAHAYTNAGTYQVMVTVTDTAGCSGTAVLPSLVHVSAGPVAHFLLSTNTVGEDDAVVQVYHDTLPSVNYAWTLDGGPVPGAGNFTLQIDPPTIGYHLLCLDAMDTLGCPARLCRSILVDDNLSVYVANAFTPDGDGLNDGFLPVVLGAEPGTYRLRIFDRWGLEVFSANDPEQAWTGAKGQGGGALPQGVYVWRIAARDRFTTDQREWFGTVTLLR